MSQESTGYKAETKSTQRWSDNIGQDRIPIATDGRKTDAMKYFDEALGVLRKNHCSRRHIGHLTYLPYDFFY
jgi:hypothetical protein